MPVLLPASFLFLWRMPLVQELLLFLWKMSLPQEALLPQMMPVQWKLQKQALSEVSKQDFAFCCPLFHLCLFVHLPLCWLEKLLRDLIKRFCKTAFLP